SFSNNAGSGVRLEALDGGQLIVPRFEPLITQLGVPVTDPDFDDLNNNGTRELGFIQNTIVNNGGAGIHVVAEGAGSLASVAFGGAGVGNTINGNATDAFVFEANDMGVIDLDQWLNIAPVNNQGAVIRVV